MGRLEEEALRQLELPRDACHLVRLQRNRRRGSSRPCSIAQRVFCGSSGPSNRLRQVVPEVQVDAFPGQPRPSDGLTQIQSSPGGGLHRFDRKFEMARIQRVDQDRICKTLLQVKSTTCAVLETPRTLHLVE